MRYIRSLSQSSDSLLVSLWISSLCLLLLVPCIGYAQARVSSNQSVKELSLFFTPKQLTLTTATLSLKSVSQAPALVTVVSDEEIERMGARDLSDVLSRLPGFSVMVNKIGNPVIVVRGLKTYGEKILLLIDGHPVNSIDSGSASWTFANMPVDDISKIEVIRGPGSALYGENAFIAVINVITKGFIPKNPIYSTQEELSLKQPKSFVRVSYGSFVSRSVSMFTGANGEDWAVTAYARFYKTNGERDLVLADALSGTTLSQYSLAPARLQDWRERQDIDLKFQYKELTWHTRFLHKRQGPFIGFTDILTNGSKRDYLYAYTVVSERHKFSNGIRLKLSLSFDQYQFDELWNGYPAGFLNEPGFENGVWGEPKGKFQSYGVNLITKLPKYHHHKIMIGGSYIRKRAYDIRYSTNFSYIAADEPVPLPGGFQDVSSTANWLSKSRIYTSDWAVFIQDDWQITDRLSMILGVRHDYFDTFGTADSPRAGLVWSFGPDVSFKLLYGEAFRAPSYNELYMVNNPAIVGNPNLKPEKVSTEEAGLSFNFLKAHCDVDVFHSEFEHLIVPSDRENQIGAFRIENSGKARVSGLEFSLLRRWNRVKLTANYSFQYSKDDNIDGRFPYTPAHMGNIILDVDLPMKFHLNTRLFMCSKRYRKPSDPRKDDPGYAIVDVSLLKKDFFCKGLQVQCTARNLLDHKYTDAAPDKIYYDFPRPGRTLWLTLEYKF